MEATTKQIEKLGYTIPEAVFASGKTRTDLYDAMAAGALKAKKAGRRTIILAAELKRWLASLPDYEPQTKQAA